MKKNIFYIMLLLLTSAATFTSCDNDSSAGVTRITYYPVLTLQGDATMHVDKGTAFADPGCKAELNGEDITSQVVTNSNVDTSKSGVYTVTYSAVNSDGFSASASRTVIVTNPADAKEGVFTTSALTCNGSTKYAGNYDIVITSNDNGTYHVTDLLGGWYAQGRGYGDNYAMVGNVSFAEDGSMNLVDSEIAGWGDSLVDFSGKFDSSTGSYTWDATYVSSMVFHVELSK